MSDNPVCGADRVQPISTGPPDDPKGVPFVFFNVTVSTWVYTGGDTLSLHDALPISCGHWPSFVLKGGPFVVTGPLLY